MTKDSSKSSISSPSATVAGKEDSMIKPIKLRAACNNCFSAKVRCDGNKEGCRRCGEKSLSCVYSESRVGKVVGKRRKRPLAEVSGAVDPDTWIINRPFHFAAIPSPPASQYSSDSGSKRQCSSNSWASFLVDEHQDVLDFEEVSEPPVFDIMNPKAFCDSSDMMIFSNNGLPTPGMSPPQLRYLSPAALEARPMSRATSTTTDSSRLLPRFTIANPQPISRTPEPEDDETVCIKLLAHLKKHSSPQKESNPDHNLDLLKKTNASVRRILRNKSIKSDYTCQLLLSSIATHIVNLCEQLSARRSEAPKSNDPSFPPEHFQFEAQPGYFDGTNQSTPNPDSPKDQVVEAANLATEIGNLLKRKPLNGYQVLGRHESHHVILDLRLQRALIRLTE